tara:strand:- start:1027 stop:1596 length:570 start_codon:yes stop_codon:yes gene_type:complete
MDKKLQISICILIGLVCLYLYDSSKQKGYQDSYIDIFNFDHSKINKVIILKGNDGIEIERNDSTWKINGHDSLIIKNSSIDKLFDETLIVKMNKLPVSSTPKDLSIYSLDSTRAINLILSDINGNTLSDAMFGISPSNYYSNFYKNSDEEAVYKTNSNIMTYLTTNLKYWGEIPQEVIPDSTVITPSDL